MPPLCIFTLEKTKIMMNYTRILGLGLLLIWLSSCTTGEEELWIEADGSGRFESTMDLSAIYPFLLMGIQQETEEEPEEDQDPFTPMLEEILQAESADTVIDLSALIAEGLEEEGRSIDMLMDSLRQLSPEESGKTQEELNSGIKMVQAMLNMKMRLKADQRQQMFQMTTINAFDDIQNFVNGAGFFESMMNLRDQSSGMGTGEQDQAIQQMMENQTQFALDGKTLQISRSGQSLEDMKEEDRQQLEMMAGMMGNQPYRLTIHFPGKVKRPKSDFAERVDKQTVVIEIPQEHLNDPDFKMELGLKFKGLKQ